MSKYNNKKTVVDGIVFHSRKEAARYIQLKQLQETGAISHLKLQPRFDFKIDGKLMFFYKADFEYCTEHGEVIIEDVKSSFTAKLPIFKLKQKIIEATYGFKISLVC